MLALNNHQSNLTPDGNFEKKVRCGEVYRNLNGNEMFQKFYYRCLECSMDFESSPEFEEHVIVHYLQEDDDCAVVNENELKNSEDVVNISSEDEETDYLYAVEVGSLVEGDVSETDLPLPLMQMLSEQSADSCDQMMHFVQDSDDEDEKNVAFPCDGLRRQALHQYSEPEKCCTRCPAYFNTKSDLNFHLHIHTLPNTVTCTHCYEVFANTITLNEHLRVRRKRMRISNDEHQFNSHGSRKKTKCNTINSSSPQNATIEPTDSNNCTTKTDNKTGQKDLKENVNADGKTNSNCNTSTKRKEADNNSIDRNSTNNITTLLEKNQSDNSTSVNAVKDT